MSLVKKIGILIVLLIGFIIYSVYAFDYDTVILNSEKKQDNVSQTNFIDKIINMFASSEYKETKPFSFVLTKKNGMLVMDGIFADENDTKKISDILNINRDGEYTYEEDVVIDEDLLLKISNLITPFKDFFDDGAKLSIINNEVFLSGDLKDPNYYTLLESKISRLDINLTEDIKISNPPLVTAEADLVKNNLTLPSEKAFNIDTKKALNVEEIQSDINNLLLDQKITFKRRSSSVTETSYPILTKISQILKDNKSIKIEIAGHTDSRGEESLNKQISQERANSVKDILVSLGVSNDNLTAVGYGEEFPLVKDDENGLSEINRRVEFNIIGE
jgi:outer membrane protein OmpA-like peptidoglycan-associated protein